MVVYGLLCLDGNSIGEWEKLFITHKQYRNRTNVPTRVGGWWVVVEKLKIEKQQEEGVVKKEVATRLSFW